MYFHILITFTGFGVTPSNSVESKAAQIEGDQVTLQIRVLNPYVSFMTLYKFVNRMLVLTAVVASLSFSRWDLSVQKPLNVYLLKVHAFANLDGRKLG